MKILISITKRQSGQAMSELIIMLPLFVILIGSAASLGYICWQGLKVQQAANVAARIQGQERVGGGTTPQGIQTENGVGQGFGDTLPELNNNDVTQEGMVRPPPASSVYGRFYQTVQNMFGPGELKKLFIPPPETGMNSDKVQVVRLLKPPKIFDFQLPAVKLEGEAYGGEDPHMYGLPRWGKVDKNDPFYQEKIKNPKNE